MKKIKRLFLSFVMLFISIVQIPAQIRTPSDFIGVEIGADYQLADYHQIIDYLHYLDERSDRLQLQDLGETTMGNRFMLAIVSSAANMKKLAQNKENLAKLADPRGLSESAAEALIDKSKTVVLINCAIHASEIGSTQWAPLFIHYLVTSQDVEVQEILKNVIVLITPSHNPDGQLLVTNWYRKHQTAPMPFLYNKYVGHDNNRDWFMFTQKETRITVEKIHNVWHPQIVHDMHQMGSTGARIFLPPYIDPFEPNVHPILIAQVNMLGETMAAALIRAGKSGVITNSIFDLWTPARAYQHYHGGVRVLTELASARIATPIEISSDQLDGRGGVSMKKQSMHFPVPWPGGKWSLRDIIDYEWIAAKAELQHAAKFRKEWLRGFYEIHRDACNYRGKTWGYLIPNNPTKQTEIMELTDVLQTAGVEISQITEDCRAGEFACKRGDYVVPLAQPYGPFARAMLAKQEYPNLVDASGKLKVPYDVVSNNLPYLMNVTIDTLFEKPAALSSAPVKFRASVADLSGVTSKYLIMPPASYGADIAAIRLGQAGVGIARLLEDTVMENLRFAAGTYIIKNSKSNRQKMHEIMTDIPVSVVGINSPGRKMPALKIKSPGIALYHSWVPSMDEGWTRWIFDHYNIKFYSLKNADVQKLNKPKKYKIILFADQNATIIKKGNRSKNEPLQYRGGIEEAGVDALKKFVRNGGTILAWGSATQLFIKEFSLRLKNAVDKLPAKKYFIPGSILAAEMTTANPFTFGLSSPCPVFFRRGRVFDVEEGEVLARFLPGNPKLTGWLTGPEYVAEKPVAVRVSYGKGQLVLLGFAPQFRAQARGTYKFMFNAILSAAGEEGNL